MEEEIKGTGDVERGDRADSVRKRFELIDRLRTGLRNRNYREVDTPVIYPAPPPDPHISPLTLARVAPGDGIEAKPIGYLRTSPEYELKRLLTLGFEAIFEIAPVFRDDPPSRLHNRGFLMAEWYRVGFDAGRLADELVEILAEACTGAIAEALAAGAARISVDEIFEEAAGISPSKLQTEDELFIAAQKNNLIPEKFDRDFHEVFSLIWVERVDRLLEKKGAVLLVDWPMRLAELARPADNGQVAERFELVINGVELANGYSELTDMREHQIRFERDLELRRKSGGHLPPVPEDFLAVIETGLPACAGLSLGLDRLAMIDQGRADINDCLARGEK